ncbi:MAG: hypothetical protein ACOC89_02450 [Candidatus Saliniplasma sp.]
MSKKESNTEHIIFECPECGTEFEKDLSRCPSCGVVFDDVETDKESLEEFE